MTCTHWTLHGYYTLDSTPYNVAVVDCQCLLTSKHVM